MHSRSALWPLACLVASALASGCGDAVESSADKEPKAAASEAGAQPSPTSAAPQSDEEARLQEAINLNAQVESLFGQGKYAEALPLAERVLAIRKEILGPHHADYATSLNNLGALHGELGNFAAAEPLHREAVEIRKEIFGENHPNYAHALSNLAHLYSHLGEDARAVPLQQQALEIRKQAFGENHPEYARSLSSLAALYARLGDYSQAEPLYRRALEIRQQVVGEDHPDYAESLNNLALLYAKWGDFAQAEPLYQRAHETCRRVLGEEHPFYASSLNNLAVLYIDMGDYARAGQYARQALELRRKLLGETHPAYASSLINLASVYEHLDDYASAEPIYRQALDIYRQAVGEHHPDYALTLSNLSLLYDRMGDYARAESLCRQALDIRKQIFGEMHPDYAASLNNLAGLYLKQGDYAQAEPLLRRTSEICKQMLGENHPYYAGTLNSLAGLYERTGDYAQAELLYREALEIRQRALGEKHPDFADSLNNLAAYHARSADYAQAEPLYLRTLEICKQALGENHSDYGATLVNLAMMYASMSDVARAERLLRQALSSTRALMEASSLVQSQRQQLAMGQAFRWPLDNYISVGLSSQQHAERVFEEVLNWKGATLMRQRAIREAASDPNVAGLFNSLQQAAAQLATLSRAAPAAEEQRTAWRAQIDELTQQKERLEAELSSQSAAFRQTTEQLTLEQLMAALPADAVLVDFLEFWRFLPPQADREAARWQPELVAFVVRRAAQPDEQVTMIGLGPVEPVNQAIDVWRQSYGQSSEGKAAGKLLREALWQPLLPHLGDRDTTVLVSADGALGRLPLAALPGRQSDTWLLEDHRLAMIPVPQLLPALTSDDKQTLPKAMLLVGNVNYDDDPEVPGGSPDGGQRREQLLRGAALRSAGERFLPLPNTDGEVATIRGILERLLEPRPEEIVRLGESAATEARFRELAPQCLYLHVATHGFFAAPQFQSAETVQAATEPSAARGGLTTHDAGVAGFAPGLLSGLALSGANRQPSAEEDDGILTAEEIASLPLSGVRLVTLSACETGLGKTAGGEGLLGLQRAFQVSGARTTIASYWKVNDLATRLLMERFYRNLWEQGMSKLDALREAQLYYLNHPEALRSARLLDSGETGQRTPPHLWAAFALSGDWR